MIASILFFLVGLQLSIEFLACFYRFIDLWYCIANYWQRILFRLIILVMIQIMLVWLLPQAWLQALLWGQLTYLVIYFGKYLLLRILVLVLETVRR